jgi:hypothetical protein
MSCPPPTELTKQEKEDRLGRILNAVGAQACMNSSGMYNNYASSNLGWGFVQESKNLETNMYSSNVGCEQLTAISNVVRDFENKVFCTLNENKAKVQTLVIQKNDIKIKIAGKLSCANGIEVNLTNDSDVQTTAELDAQMKQTIENQVKQTVQQTADILQTSETEAGATPQGGKSFSDNLNEFNSQNTINNIMKNVSEIFNEIQQKNVLEFEILSGGDVTVSDGKCIFTVTNTNKLVAKAVTKSVMDTMFKDLKDRGIIQTVKSQQQSKNTGFATILEQLAKVLNALGGGWGQLFGMIIVVIVLVVVVKSIGGGSGGDGGSGEGSKGSLNKNLIIVGAGILFIVLGGLTQSKIIGTSKVTGTGVQTSENNSISGIGGMVIGAATLLYGGYNAYNIFKASKTESSVVVLSK